MPTSKELREQRAKLVKDARSILDKADAEKREPTAEERQQWDRIMGGTSPDGNRVEGEEERLKKRIDQLERQEFAEHEMRSPAGGRQPGREDVVLDGEPVERGPSEETRCLALQAWMRNECRLDLSDPQRAAMLACKPKSDKGELILSLHRDNYNRVRADMRKYQRGEIEYRAGSNSPQSTLVTSSGGALIPEGFVNSLESALLQYGGIRELAEVMRTASGNPLPWPMNNDTGVTGAIVAENASATTADLTFSVMTLLAHKYTSKPVLVPVELLEDSAFNLAAFIGDACGTRIGRIQASHFTTGTGTGQPNGAVTAATSGLTAASSTALAADELYGLKHSVDPAYRKTGCAWSMHDNTLLVIKKLKDGMGRYLWQAGLAGGAPDMIDSNPVVINQSMASSLTSGAKPILYGQHSKYKIRDVAEVRMRRLVERYADQDQEAFIMFVRTDGNLLDAGTHPLKYITMA